MLCLICKKEIKIDEYYYIITQFDKGKQIGEEFLHQNCWHKSTNVFSLAKKAEFALDKVLEDILGIKKQEVIEIK